MYREKGQPVLWILAGTLSVGMLQSVAARGLCRRRPDCRFARLMPSAALNLGLSLPGPLMGTTAWLGTMIPNVAMCIYVSYACMMLMTDQMLARQSLMKPLAATECCGWRGGNWPTCRRHAAGVRGIIGAGGDHTAVVAIIEFD